MPNFVMPNFEDSPIPNRAVTADVAADTAAAISGAELDRFVILQRIASGGMGQIYAAYDTRLDRKVAIKMLRRDIDSLGGNARQRLLREAQTLARISHPNVVHVYEAGVSGDVYFIVMEFVRGVTLSTWLAHHASDPNIHWRMILGMFIDAGRGLAAVHEAGLIHRDFKPSNVLVGEDGRVRVVDFGLARTEASGEDADIGESASSGVPIPIPQVNPSTRLTCEDTAVGTPAYMAPEQLSGTADRRSDQYSFSVALFEALYGKLPYPLPLRKSSPHRLRQRIVEGAIEMPPWGSKVPTSIWHTLVRGLSPMADARHPSMDTLLDKLERTLKRRKQWRRWWPAAMTLVFAGMLLGVASTLGTQCGIDSLDRSFDRSFAPSFGGPSNQIGQE